jgi:hypothetical protein
LSNKVLYWSIIYQNSCNLDLIFEGLDYAAATQIFSFMWRLTDTHTCAYKAVKYVAAPLNPYNSSRLTSHAPAPPNPWTGHVLPHMHSSMRPHNQCTCRQHRATTIN